jgi:hypothetical protein
MGYAMITAELSRPPAHVRQQSPNRNGVAFHVATGGIEYLYKSLAEKYTSGTGAGTYSSSGLIGALIPSSPEIMIGTVRDVFGLNVTQASRVFRVERPTVYLWSSMNTSSKIKGQNLERMKALYMLAVECKRNGMLTKDALQWPLADSTTFLDKISEEEIDAAKLIPVWKLIGSVKEQLLETRKARGRAFGMALAESIGSLDDKEKIKRKIFGEDTPDDAVDAKA